VLVALPVAPNGLVSAASGPGEAQWSAQWSWRCTQNAGFEGGCRDDIGARVVGFPIPSPHSPAPVPPSNRLFRHTYNPLFSNAFCVCQIDTVLHYSLRTESRKESKRAGNGQICGIHQTPWHTQNRPEPRVTRGKCRNDKANREQLALNSGGAVRTRVQTRS
jgi:hypothetical protein